MRFILLLLCPLFLLNAQNKIELNTLHSNFALKSSRELYKKELNEKIKRVSSAGLSSSTEKAWVDMFKDISLACLENEIVYSILKTGFENFDKRGLTFQRALLETGFAIYPDSFKTEIINIYNTTSDPMLFAYTAQIQRSYEKSISLVAILNKLYQKFPGYAEDNILRQFEYDLVNDSVSLRSLLPPIEELLNHPFEKNATIIYSLFSKNREYPGLTVIKAPDGSFVKDESGEIFSVPQMGVSVSNLPAYVRGGNTPQGIFSIVGWYVSPTDEIGPTPCVLTRIPFEKPPSTFFHNNNKYKTWNIEDYKKLLPGSWKNYAPMYQSYYCGKMGRGLIVMHGSVDDLSFYKDKPYYPMTPTKGCLVTKELWDENTGNVIESDQAKLFNAFISTGNTNGYLVVLDLIDDNRGVTLDDVKKYLKTE